VEAIRSRIESLEGLTEEMVLKKYNIKGLEEMPNALLAVCNRDLNAWEAKIKNRSEAV